MAHNAAPGGDMSLIYIHGRAQEEYIGKEQELLDIWNMTLKRGCDRLSTNTPVACMAFYADILDQAVKERSRPFSTADGRRGGDGESIAIMQELSAEYHLDEPESSHRSFTNRLGAIVDGWGVGDVVMRGFLRDIAIYLGNDSVREAINTRVHAKVQQTLHSDRSTKLKIIGHSLGSIVAYLYLCYAPPETRKRVVSLITIGSPLGTASVGRHVKNILGPSTPPFPEISGPWLNFADDRDRVPLSLPIDRRTLMSGIIDASVINHFDIRNETPNRHGIAGYLDDPIIASCCAR
jgi:hypothetical protein